MSDAPTNQAGNTAVAPTGLERLLAWLNKRERVVLLLGVALQIVVLLAMIAQRATPLVYGDTVLLRVVPVDPRDLFRGDYVILSYEFSRMPPGGIAGLPRSGSGRNQWQGRTVYVSLVPETDGKHWRAGEFSVYRPASGKFLQGRITGWNRLEFGIESYYVQEGTGRKYEQAIRNRTLSAEVAVTSDGRATLRRLHIE